MRKGVLSLAVLGLLCAAGAGQEPVPAERPAARMDRLAPVVVGTDDLGPSKKPGAPPSTVAPGKPAREIRVDEKAHAVRVPVRFTRAKGVVEWILASGNKHPAASVLVTEHSAKDLAAALLKAGLAAGARPQPVGDDHAQPPTGPALQIDVVMARPDGKETRLPVARFFAAKSSGEPAGEGGWVYVGPQTVREGEADILVTELSGSIVTTNLRDPSAMIYWVPKGTNEPAPYAATYYASNTPLPPEGEVAELEIRPAPPPEKAKRDKAAKLRSEPRP